jgi:1,2-diacylglycerol 3-alpha-glucosyltransferase
VFRARADALGIADRCFFVGEQSLGDMADWYAHADLFLYTSLSETYGQVISEALYAGVPVVAFSDGMGVSGQVTHGEDGLLVAPGPNERSADEAFGAAVLTLMGDGSRRRAYAAAARELARVRCDAKACIGRYFGAFETAREHVERTWQPRALVPTPVGPLVRWAGMHSLMAGIGLLREPVTVNRSGAKAPNWTRRHVG